MGFGIEERTPFSRALLPAGNQVVFLPSPDYPRKHSHPDIIRPGWGCLVSPSQGSYPRTLNSPIVARWNIHYDLFIAFRPARQAFVQAMSDPDFFFFHFRKLHSLQSNTPSPPQNPESPSFWPRAVLRRTLLGDPQDISPKRADLSLPSCLLRSFLSLRAPEKISSSFLCQPKLSCIPTTVFLFGPFPGLDAVTSFSEGPLSRPSAHFSLY